MEPALNEGHLVRSHRIQVYEGQSYVQLEAGELITVDGCTCVHESCPLAYAPSTRPAHHAGRPLPQESP
ncbi:hypothetical protein [Nocardia cyriacigeorgica]|uniref:hypothetical protein n=1 Tax=Nocardia cyriacigeorgica TaxID=135487 RepID=UPI0018939E03|nr:hypothetical protein [Nocardia cyriacigeorgica]MBF6289831.1 hypothetical protein [Nocardia cyriacigeorgica]